MRTAILAALLLAAGNAAAQENAMVEKLRKQAEEVARLMRESERMLLEITRVDRMVETQEQIVDELRKLVPPEPPPEGAAGGADEETARKRQQLEEKQAELSRRLEHMLSGQKQSAEMTVKQLEELLRSLPRQQSQQQGQGDRDQKPKSSDEERERRLREKREQEKQQQQQPRSPREKGANQKDPKMRGEKRPEQDTQAARMRRIEAWIARLPPEEQERINRNDFSNIPLRYRRLVEEYTAERAKREAERDAERDR